jgi:hypothetical protein
VELSDTAPDLGASGSGGGRQWQQQQRAAAAAAPAAAAPAAAAQRRRRRRHREATGWPDPNQQPLSSLYFNAQWNFNFNFKFHFNWNFKLKMGIRDGVCAPCARNPQKAIAYAWFASIILVVLAFICAIVVAVQQASAVFMLFFAM